MYEKHNETIKARVFLEALQSDATSITFTNCIIEGVVDIFSVALERDENDRILLNKSLSCIGCTFKNIVNFRTVVFQKDVDFRRTLFEADLDLDETILHGSCAFREAIFQRRADFHSAIFHKSASFWRARFNNAADFHRVEFRKNAVFHEAYFYNEVNFRRTLFQGILDCTGTWFSETTTFNNATFLGTANFTGAQFVTVAAFRDVQYIPNTLLQFVKDKLGRRRHHPTEFYLDSQYVDEVENPFFKRYVADQQFIRAFNQANPVLARLWRWSSDYGRSLALWASWSILFVFLFAIAYRFPFPAWMSLWLVDLTPHFHQITGTYSGKPLTFWDCFYFSVVTFTTLGFGDVVADNTAARFLVTLEVIFGYVMLGGLISIFANKLASRS
ncbi:potassium channel family protein [Candidatus Poribacteria bacterium]|nr:potassium channel family protein [Candidatus Poribacteria bacterium]MYK22565.1 potassium channel family protein [Candidatus Poribacteria bacterium]